MNQNEEKRAKDYGQAIIQAKDSCGLGQAKLEQNNDLDQKLKGQVRCVTKSWKRARTVPFKRRTDFEPCTK